MTATQVSAPIETKTTSAAGAWATDVGQMALRTFRHTLRSPELVMFSLLQPVMFILLFTYVFGGAIAVEGNNYPQFLVPGILVQMVLFGSAAGTTLGVSVDMARGIMDRFRSMPLSRSAVLIGRSLAEISRNVVAIAVMLIIGFLIGFRFEGGVARALLALGLVLLFGYAVGWLAAFIGLAVPNPEAAQSVGMVWIFPFSLISSAFVPTDTMPGWLQVYANYSPMTVVVNAARGLFSGTGAGTDTILALLYSVGLMMIFAPLAVRKFAARP